MTQLKRKIEGKKAVVSIIGLGYVGLPLATVAANKGYTVIGADIKKESVHAINKGISPIKEPGLDRAVAQAVSTGRLRATLHSNMAAREADIVIVVVQTPIDSAKEPDLRAFTSAWKTVAENLTPGKLLISESTVPPGTMKKVVLPMLEEKGLQAGRDFYLAYSPERAIPTRTLQEIEGNDRIVGGIDPASTEAAALFYRQITKGEIAKTDIETAEVVKVIENAYRDVNIAFANEVALLCGRLGIDATSAINLANRHPRVNIHTPGPGVGGHCIPKDPYFLLKSAKEAGLELKLVSAAREVNEAMPGHVLDLIKRSLKEAKKDPEKAKISILGIAYKGNTDDSRNSPAEPIVRGLMAEKMDVISHDPYVTQDFGGRFSNDIEEVVKDSDCLVIVTDHDAYRQLDLGKLKKQLKRPCIIIDSRSLFRPEAVEAEGLRYVGLGG
ncbi:MAG: nucleotide sugar dehydrogenase [Methanobacteriota archaeon]|nr:MAG: nucleotide sugar dehydrogenase [Euryarchaeota archaeon]